MISFIIRLTSAWKTNFSAESLSCFISDTLRPSSLTASSSLRVCVCEGGRGGGGRGDRGEREEGTFSKDEGRWKEE